MKVCPVCGSRCFDDMEVCYGCLHDFTREDTSPAGQALASPCEGEVEEAVMPAARSSHSPSAAASCAPVANEMPSMPSRVPLIAEQPTTQLPRDGSLGGGVARIAQSRVRRGNTHIVVPLDGCGGEPALAQGFRLVISVEPAT